MSNSIIILGKSMATMHYWNYKKSLKDMGLPVTLQGYALSARHSGFYIPEWKVMFDAGISSDFSDIKYIFITHCHSDHIGKLIPILHGIKSQPNIYVPKGLKKFVHNHLVTFRQMTQMNEDRTDYPGTIHEVEPGNVIQVNIGSGIHEVEVFATDHTVPSQGYAISKYVKQKKPEYMDRPDSELKVLAQQGVAIKDTIKYNLIVYTGDTNNNVFYMNPQIDWNSFKIIITECTYIDSIHDAKDKADGVGTVDELVIRNKHNSFNNLMQTLVDYPDTTYIFCHWSLRYKKEDIVEAFKGTEQKVIPWIF